MNFLALDNFSPDKNYCQFKAERQGIRQNKSEKGPYGVTFPKDVGKLTQETKTFETQSKSKGVAI